MKQILLMAVVLGCTVASPLPAHPCFCITPELSESFKQSRAVFLGEVGDIAKKTSNEGAPFADGAFTIKFKILQSWKGIASGTAEFTILWLTDCYECLDLPHVKDRYLVFADPAAGSESWSIVASCNRTTAVDDDPKLRLMNPDAVDRFREMKQLDIITERALALNMRALRRAEQLVGPERRR